MSGTAGAESPAGIRFGIVTRTPEDLGWEGVDRDVFEAKGPAGRTAEPRPAATNAIACFRDGASVEASPELAQRDANGGRQADTDAAAVCPTASAYRTGLLETVGEAAEVAADIRLDHIGFAGASYCRCERCESVFATAPAADWREWRVGIVTDFVAAARERVPGRLSVSVHPDPTPGRLADRAGIDLDGLAGHVDEVVIPLYDDSYGTTYWLEVIAGGFAVTLPDEVALGVELYAGDVQIDALLEAVAAVETHADTVYFGFGVDTAIAAIRRRRAEGTPGEVYGP